MGSRRSRLFPRLSRRGDPGRIVELGLRFSVVGNGADDCFQVLSQAKMLKDGSGVVADLVGEYCTLFVLLLECVEQGFDTGKHDGIVQHDRFEVGFEMW